MAQDTTDQLLADQVFNDLDDSSAVVKGCSIGNRSVEHYSLKELRDHVAWLERRAEAGNGIKSTDVLVEM